MKLVYGICFSDNEHYLTDNGEISGWELIHKHIETKLPNSTQFQLMRFNITDKNAHYCLVIKLYSEDRNFLSIPFNEILDDHKKLDLSKYFAFLKECSLINLPNYLPNFCVIH